MVSVAVGVARCELRIDQYEDTGESQRQEDRRGTLAVDNGPPMRGRGGVADRGASPLGGRLGLSVSGPRSYYALDPPRVERHSASPSCVFAAGRLLGSSRDVGPPAPRKPASSLTSADWEVP